MLITYEFILDSNGDKIYYMDENGNKITSRTSMNIEGMYYSFDDMGNVTLIINSLTVSYTHLKEGHNVLLKGPGGMGKTSLCLLYTSTDLSGGKAG